MDRRRLGGIIHRGGTVLGTERSAEFATPEGQRKAAGKLAEAGVEGLVVIGGDGSLTGGLRLAELGVEVVGSPRDHRQRRVGHGHGHWRGHGAQHGAGGHRQDQGHRELPPAGPHRGGDGPRLGLPGTNERHSGRGRGRGRPRVRAEPGEPPPLHQEGLRAGQVPLRGRGRGGRAGLRGRTGRLRQRGRRHLRLAPHGRRATSSAAASPRPRTGSSRAGSARPRSRPWPTGSPA